MSANLAESNPPTGETEHSLAPSAGSDFVVAAMVDIQRTAKRARKTYASQGHHCDFRRAIDSIIDRSELALRHYLETRNQNDVSQRRVPAPDDRKQNTAATGTSSLH
jgi:hypothetical protein